MCAKNEKKGTYLIVGAVGTEQEFNSSQKEKCAPPLSNGVRVRVRVRVLSVWCVHHLLAGKQELRSELQRGGVAHGSAHRTLWL